MTVLVVDVGTSNVRAGVVNRDGSIAHVHRLPVPPTTPAENFVEFDPAVLADAALAVARGALADAGPVEAVGVTNQRASTVLWDRQSGQAVGPGVGWQDLRTVGMCLALQSEGIRLAPNESATKLVFLLDWVDPGRERDLCFGTVDTWIAWALSGGSLHVTDPSNAACTGLMEADASGWSPAMLEALRVPDRVLPAIVDSSGAIGEARALAGSPPITAMVGDQQASLIGQGCIRPGMTKITFGTGGMLDLCLGADRPSFPRRGPHGSFPIVAWRRDGRTTWGLEAVMLTAGQAVEWLCDDMGLIANPAESATVAAAAAGGGDVWFVPALQGLGTPQWDFGARGTLLGLTRGVGRNEIVRAVLEGVAHRAVDLVEAAEADSGMAIASLRVDGGMSVNPTFVQALADAAQRPVEVSAVPEATTLGAGFLAGLAAGMWADEEEVASLWAPARLVEPSRRRSDRDRWQAACQRAQRWLPELSAIDF